MTYTSIPFWIFFTITLIVYWIFKKSKTKNLIILLASFVFYGWFNPWFALLLLISIGIDFCLQVWMEKDPPSKKALLILSISINILVLLFFKFFSQTFNELLAPLFRSWKMAVPDEMNILFPIGLSFYTLRKISYSLDCYRKKLPTRTSLVNYALYVSFFPQIISGPIDNPRKLLPQFIQERRWKGEYFYDAWPLLLMGFFKKIFVADKIKVIVDNIYSLQKPSFLLFIVGTLGFTIEVLADFSAYTDLARGIALLLGFQTSENFNSPYLSKDPNDFWSRWHITLSTWLRENIFFPIRRYLLKKGQRFHTLASLAPPLITMLVSGIWHGNGLTFLIWGLYWGVMIVIFQYLPSHKQTRFSSLRNFCATFGMLILICFGWAIFRAYSIQWLFNVIVHPSWELTRDTLIVVLLGLSLIAFYSLPWLVKLIIDTIPKKLWIFETAYYVMITILIIIFSQSASPDFIYFHF